MLLHDEQPTLRLERDATTTTGVTGGVASLFGLSMATALPPMALLTRTDAVLPTLRRDPHAMLLSPAELAAVLGQPVTEAWRGRIELGGLDPRLRGLESVLVVFQAIDGSGALICLSTIEPHPVAGDERGATPADLWALVCEALVRCGVAHRRELAIGPDAVLAVYGEITAQVAWLDGDRVATVSVTRLTGQRGWPADTARMAAAVLKRQLAGRSPAA